MFYVQISDGFGPGLQMNSRDSVYSNHPQQNSNVQPLGVGNNSYSLFSTSSWGAIRAGENDPDQSYGLSSGMMAQQVTFEDETSSKKRRGEIKSNSFDFRAFGQVQVHRHWNVF